MLSIESGRNSKTNNNFRQPNLMPPSCSTFNHTLTTPNSSLGNLMTQAMPSSRLPMNQPHLEFKVQNLQGERLPQKERKPTTTRSTSCLRISRSESYTAVYQAHYNETGPLLVSSDLINGYLAIEILKSGTNAKASATQEVRAKYLKNKILKYLRIAKEDRSKYYLSKYELIRNPDDQLTDRPAHRVERIMSDKEMVNPQNYMAEGGNVESLMLRLG